MAMPELDQLIQAVPVAGIQKLTTIDYPGYLAAVLFVGGCPWNCRYCHNASLRMAYPDEAVTEDRLRSFLADRQGFLEGVVVSGGEPTSHDGLPELLKLIREYGYRVAIHTNGFYPEMLKRIVHDRLADYIAMDVKGPARAYDRITRVPNSCAPVARSIDIVASSGIEHEFRTTFHPKLLSEAELLETMTAVARKSSSRFFIQMFRKDGVEDDELVRSGDVLTVPAVAIMRGEKLFREFGVR